jgi:hypothetical protein
MALKARLQHDFSEIVDVQSQTGDLNWLDIQRDEGPPITWRMVM